MTRAEREEQIVSVAEQLFAERGYQAASMDELAERVGVSKPMLYEYFGSKEGVLRACVARARVELLQVTREAVAEAPTLREMLRLGLRVFFQFADTHTQGWRVLRQEAALAGAPGAAEIETVRSQQSGFIVAMLSPYLPSVDGSALEAYAEITIGACERLAVWREGHPEITPDQATDCLIDLVWTGLERLLARYAEQGPAEPEPTTAMTR
jgi:AcrR family transcriptional regulator